MVLFCPLLLAGEFQVRGCYRWCCVELYTRFNDSQDPVAATGCGEKLLTATHASFVLEVTIPIV